METNYTTILTTILLIVATCVIFLLYQRSKSLRRGILLTGLCGSGKTVLFAKLVYNKYANTVTSMKENCGNFVTAKGNLTMVDIPGYERLRLKYLDQYKSVARAVIFVIDSNQITQDIRDVAEFLYTILADPVVSHNVSNILVVCNKQDLTLVKSATVIKSMLEKELNAVIYTKGSQLEVVDQKVSKKVNLVKEGQDFTFSNLTSVKVGFVESSVTENKDDLGEVNKWLHAIL